MSAFGQVFSQVGFSDAFVLSIKLAVITTVLTLVLMVPTTIYVHLRLPAIRPLLESITILPIVIPPVVLILGVLEIAPAEPEGHAVPAGAGLRHPGDAVRLPVARRRAAGT